MNDFLDWFGGKKEIGLLTVRIVLGVILLLAGYQKLFVYGISGVSNSFAGMGLVGAPVLGFLVSILEFFGGVAILLGVFTRLLSLWVIVQFTLITVWVKPVLLDKGWADVRIDLTLAALGVLILTHGVGPVALAERVFKGRKWAE